MQDCPEAKKPCKGILKSSSSFDRPSASYRKSAKFDELNVLQTYHPVDKDYGHMKIDEPKTPYNYVEPNLEHQDQLDANLLAEKLRIAANTQTPSFGDDNVSDEEFPETEEEKIRRLEFERRRKAHYNEFEAVRLARKLIEEELGDDEEGEEDLDHETSSKSKTDYLSLNRNNVEEEHIPDDHEEVSLEYSSKSETGESVQSPPAPPAAPRVSGVTRPMDVDQHFDSTQACHGRD